jgi:hypothetical protein
MPSGVRTTKLASLALIALLLASLAAPARAGPFSGMIAYGLCQTGCNVAAATCYGAAGLVIGTTTAGLGVPAAALACSATQGACMAACAVMAGITAVTPTP